MDGLFCYHLVIMFLATVAILLIWVGFATPGWLVVTFQEDLAAHEYTVSSLNRSLYYDILCPQELKTCEPCEGDQLPNDCIATTYNSTNYNYHYSWVEGLIQDKEEWTAWRVIMTIVVVAALVGWILVLVLVCCLLRPYVYRIVATTAFFLWLAVDQQTIVVVAALVGWILVLVLVCCLLRPYVYRIIATTAFFSWLAVAILVWIPVGMVADMHLDIDDTINDDVPHDATLHVPYSVVLVAVGGFIALITALMLIYLIGICGKNGRSSASRSDTEEIFSEPSKRTPPTLVHDRMYYGPYPYYQPEQQIVYRETAPVKYRYQTPTIVPYTQYPGSVVEEEVLSEYPQYKPGTPVTYRYQTPTIVPYTQYPGSVVEEEVLSEYPQYKGVKETPVTYRYQTPTIVPYTQYPGSVVEEEVLSEYPQYKGEDGAERWYDNRAWSTNLTNIPRV